MASHQDNFRSGAVGSPKMTNDDKIRKIEKDNFDLRRQVEDQSKAINALRENYTKQQNDLKNTKAQNQLLETKSVSQEAEITRLQGIFVNTCKKRDPHALNKKLEEINGKLQATEKELKSEKNENQKLKRKLTDRDDDDNHTECEENIRKKRRKLAEKCQELYRVQHDLKNEQEKCTLQASELANVREALKIANVKISQLEGDRDSRVDLIKTQNDVIREMKDQVSLLQPALDEIQRLQQSLEEAHNNTRDLEQTVESCNSKVKKLQSRSYRLTAKLKKKQTELDDKLYECNHLFKFAQDVGILIQLPLNNNTFLHLQLPELLSHLKETLQVGGCIVQYQQHNEQLIPPPQQLAEEDDGDDHDQLFDEFTSQSMMNISFPLPSSSSLPQHSTNIIHQRSQTTVIIMPQQSTKAAETTENAGNSQDSLFKEIMSNLHQSVNETKLTTKVRKAPPPPRAKQTVVPETKKATAPPPPRAKQSVAPKTRRAPPPQSRAKGTVIPKTKKHEEVKSKRKTGRGKNCEGGAKYFCKCGVMERSLDRLEAHMKQFNREKKFKCEICPQRFLYVGHLTQHLTSSHGVPPHSLANVLGCRSCGKIFTDRELHSQHQLTSCAHNDPTSTTSVIVSNELATKPTSDDKVMATVPTSAVTTASKVKSPFPQPNNARRRVPSVCMDPEDEEVNVET